MNPLDLPGPAFLAFYLALAAIVLGAMFYLRDRGEARPLPKVSELGPYAMAYMRAGSSEMLCIAAVSLLDRGLLEIRHGEKFVAKPGVASSVRRPFERALLYYFSTPKSPSLIFTDAALAIHTAGTEKDLVRLGIVPSPEQRAQRVFRAVLAFVILGGLGTVKTMVAIARGHHNVLFLVVLTIVSVLLIYKIQSKRLTKLGDRALNEAQTLCTPLLDRRASLTLGEGSFELSLLIGAFGLSALSGAPRVALKPLFPKAFSAPPSTSGSSDWTSSSCGSSCGSSGGSSCGSSGGSSCGGGGCGGCGGD